MTKSLLTERAPLQISVIADILIQFITDEIPVEEMRKKRGADYSSTKFYQIRVKPIDRESELQSVIDMIMKALKSPKAKKLNISEVQYNERSRNSGKFSSVSFSANDFDFDVVVAYGANRGETFEQDLLIKMDNLVAGIESSDEAKKAFAALEAVDPAFKITNVLGVSPRSGSTQRSGDMTPQETGMIIADLVVDLKKGGKKYISVKNKRGSTVAQFGISKAFSDSLKINAESSEWKNWLKPFNLDTAKIEEGLVAARDKKDLKWDDVDTTVRAVKKSSAIYKLMEKMWGLDYYYLRETTGGFIALKIDQEYLDSVLLSGLRITEIRYPSKIRKQINVYLESNSMKFKLEARNARGRGDVRPTQIQLSIMKSTG